MRQLSLVTGTDVQVGRPRPNFVARCWPDGNKKFLDSGLPDCAANAVDPNEGRKSFPSGKNLLKSRDEIPLGCEFSDRIENVDVLLVQRRSWN